MAKDEKSFTGDDITELKTGDKVKINGYEYIVNKYGGLSTEEDETEKNDFRLIFKKNSLSWDNEKFVNRKDASSDQKWKIVKDDKKTFEIDILPLLEEIFSKEMIPEAVASFKGFQYRAEDRVPTTKMLLTEVEIKNIENEFNDLFNSVFTNSRQLESMTRNAKRLLNNPFDNFYKLLW